MYDWVSAGPTRVGECFTGSGPRGEVACSQSWRSRSRQLKRKKDHRRGPGPNARKLEPAIHDPRPQHVDPPQTSQRLVGCAGCARRSRQVAGAFAWRRSQPSSRRGLGLGEGRRGWAERGGPPETAQGSSPLRGDWLDWASVSKHDILHVWDRQANHEPQTRSSCRSTAWPGSSFVSLAKIKDTVGRLPMAVSSLRLFARPSAPQILSGWAAGAVQEESDDRTNPSLQSIIHRIAEGRR